MQVTKYYFKKNEHFIKFPSLKLLQRVYLVVQA